MSDTPRGEEYEAQHVHSVYEDIASHFSSTRYKVIFVKLSLHQKPLSNQTR